MIVVQMENIELWPFQILKLVSEIRLYEFYF